MLILNHSYLCIIWILPTVLPKLAGIARMLQVSKTPGAISNNSIFDIQQYSAKNVNPLISKLIGKIFIISSLSEFLTEIETNANL